MELPERPMYAPSIKSRTASGAGSTIGSPFKGHPPLSAAIRLADAIALTGAAVGVTVVAKPQSLGHCRAIDLAALTVILVFSLFPQNAALPPRRKLAGHIVQAGHLVQVTAALACATLAGAVVMAILNWPRSTLLSICFAWFVTNFFALVMARAAGSYALAHPRVNERIARKVAVIGSDEHAWHVGSLCQADETTPIYFLGVFGPDRQSAKRYALDGSIEDLIELSRNVSLDDIIIAVPPDDNSAEIVVDLRRRLCGVASEVYITPYLARAEDALPIERFGPFVLMVVQRRPLTRRQALQKRMVDLALGMLLLALLCPVLAVTALAVKLDLPGPVLFRQPRIGLNDRSFTVFKFRSMYANSSDLMAARQTSRHDPRITQLGKWLRKLSLDELPQLFNVLAGDMSLVGPRPHAPHTRAGGQLLKDVMAEYVIRHQVKPGITGWAQVNGSRGELVTTEDLRRRVRYDLEYIQKWSLWLDLRIIALTIIREVFSKHAF